LQEERHVSDAKGRDFILLHESSLWNAAVDALDESRRPSSKRE